MQAEQQLKATLKEISDLKAALDEHAIVAITDSQGKITYVNDKFCAISKYSRHELLGQDHRIINSGHHSKSFIRELWTTIAGGKVWKGEIKNKAKDGTFYWVDTTIVPFLNEDGKPRQYVAIRADITSRKLAEEALRLSESRFRSTLDNMLEGCQIIGFNWRYTYVNAVAARQSRRSKSDLVGLTIMEAYPGIESAPVFTAIRRCMIDRISQELENELRYDDGGSAWFQLVIQPVPEGIFILSMDITERKRAGERVHQLNLELEQRVRDRTAELEAVNKELEAFSYSVSHDLRAPLRAVNGFAGIVLEDYGRHLPVEGRRYLERIQAGGRRMGELIDDLLALSRLSRQSMNRETVDIGGLVREVIAELNAQTDGRKVQFKVRNLPPCNADTGLIRQVWVNLITNAVKYTRHRNPARIQIGCSRDNGRNVYFVADNGAGFDMQYASKLFGVFQRLHRADEFEGTGVGLAIAQRIIHRHGGHIWAEAAVDRGATFRFTLEEPQFHNP
ncbi:MAG TPA: PAS domain S-box protein [Verrucomicrobiota bacterium]|nr:PAS domain S-box protein [Verrucomicrobiota bacterium]